MTITPMLVQLSPYDERWLDEHGLEDHVVEWDFPTVDELEYACGAGAKTLWRGGDECPIFLQWEEKFGRENTSLKWVESRGPAENRSESEFDSMFHAVERAARGRPTSVQYRPSRDEYRKRMSELVTMPNRFGLSFSWDLCEVTATDDYYYGIGQAALGREDNDCDFYATLTYATSFYVEEPMTPLAAREVFHIE
ncbi:MAG: hypothetical protein KJO75_18795 [Dactylosporangium sp.]|nr:hypothetical protein [Dactylosporangium sp.]